MKYLLTAQNGIEFKNQAEGHGNRSAAIQGVGEEKNRLAGKDHRVAPEARTARNQSKGKGESSPSRIEQLANQDRKSQGKAPGEREGKAGGNQTKNVYSEQSREAA